MQPRPQLLGAHPADARGTGVLLDASERLGQVPAGDIEGPPRRGERRCHPAPDRCCALTGDPRASPSDPPVQAPRGVGCLHRLSHEHKRPASRLRVRPFPAITIPGIAWVSERVAPVGENHHSPRVSSCSLSAAAGLRWGSHPPSGRRALRSSASGGGAQLRACETLTSASDACLHSGSGLLARLAPREPTARHRR